MVSDGFRASVVVAAVLYAGGALAQTGTLPETDATLPREATTPRAPEAPPDATAGSVRASSHASVTFAGYAEAFYQWNFNDPANGVTRFRGFDNRHNSFTISNAVLDVSWTLGPTQGRVALQVGHTPETYYGAEPDRPGGSGAGASDLNVWKYIQQANVGWRTGLGRGLLIEGGIFLSPVGPESIPVKDSWNWSRSNLFFGLPYYHTGLRVSYPVTERLSVSVAGFNGWNSVVDNNVAKSVVAQVTYTLTDRLALSVLYFGGIERDEGAAEGPAWRHLFDGYVQWSPTRRVSLMLHANGGFEMNRLGTAWWAAGALYARFRIARPLYLALRGDYFHESAPTDAGGSRVGAIFWPVDWMSSQTVTLDARPVENVSVRLEYRHDHAAGDVYYRGDVMGDGRSVPFRPNALAQDSVTLGLAAWF